jgi:hypothetical protein
MSWLLIVAIVLPLAQQPPEVPKDQRAAESNRTKSARNTNGAKNDPTQTVQPTPAASQPPIAPESQRNATTANGHPQQGNKQTSDEDRATQRKLTGFTGALVVVGFLQTLVMFLTWIIYRRQAHEMRRQRHEMRRQRHVMLDQWRAMQGQLAATERSGKQTDDIIKSATEQVAAMQQQAVLMEGQLKEMQGAGAQINQQLEVMRGQLKAMQEQTDATNKTLVLTQRPRIKVKAFYFREIKGVGGIHRDSRGVETGSQASGQFYIQNCGGTDARIREIWQDIYIASSLPMQRPYEGKEGSKDEKTLKPGDSATYLFGFFEPLDAKTYADIMEFKTKRFYVLGWIGYTDNLDIYRRTAFCRVYEPAIDRFVPVDDPDYEYAD